MPICIRFERRAGACPPPCQTLLISVVCERQKSVIRVLQTTRSNSDVTLQMGRREGQALALQKGGAVRDRPSLYKKGTVMTIPEQTMQKNARDRPSRYKVPVLDYSSSSSAYECPPKMARTCFAVFGPDNSCPILSPSSFNSALTFVSTASS